MTDPTLPRADVGLSEAEREEYEAAEHDLARWLTGTADPSALAYDVQNLLAIIDRLVAPGSPTGAES